MRQDGEGKFSFRLKNARESLSDEERLEEIRQIAYDSYEQKGRVPGTEFASWLEAAQIVKGREEQASSGKVIKPASFSFED